jgi:hypothetical protein
MDFPPHLHRSTEVTPKSHDEVLSRQGIGEKDGKLPLGKGERDGGLSPRKEEDAVVISRLTIPSHSFIL